MACHLSCHQIRWTGQVTFQPLKFWSCIRTTFINIHGDHTWRHHQMESFSVFLALCEGNPPITVEFPSQRPVTRSFAVFFFLGLKQQLSKQWRRRWFETPSRSLWHHYNEKFRWLSLPSRQRKQIWYYFQSFFFNSSFIVSSRKGPRHTGRYSLAQ